MPFSTTADLKSLVVWDPLVVSSDTTTIDAIADMHRAQVAPQPLDNSCRKIRSSCALVVSAGQYVGILTAQDVVRLCAQHRDLACTTVGQVMTSTASGLLDSELVDLPSTVHLMQERGTNYLPILNECNYPIGLVTCASLQSALEQELHRRQHIEALLFESERRYATLATIAPVGIFRTDATGRCTYVNDRYCQITGATSSRILDDGWLQCVDPDDRDTVVARWEQACKNNQPFQLEYRFRRPDATVAWVYSQAIVEYNAAGQAMGYVGALIDISDRKRAEAQLQSLLESTAATTGQDFFPALAQHISQALNVSHAGVTEKIGDELQVLAFYADGDLQPCGSFDATNLPCGRTLRDGSFYFEGLIRQAFVEAENTTWGNLNSYLGVALSDSTGQAIGTLFVMDEHVIQDPQRASQILHVFAIRAAAELERQTAHLMLEQLNQQLEAKVEERTATLQDREQFLQTVLDTFPLSVFWKDQNFVYRGGNRNFLRDANAASVAEIIGKTDYDMPWDASEATGYRADDQEVMTSNIAKLGIEETRVQADGNQVWVETNKLPLHNRAGDVIGVLGTYQDIGDRIRAEQELRESQQFIQTILDTLPIPVIWKDRNSVYLGCNQRMATVFGLTSPDEIVGKTDFDMVNRSEADHFRADDREVIASGLPKLEIEEPLTLPNGDQRWLITNKVPLRSLTGEVSGVLVTIQDITERKRAEVTLRESEERFRRSIVNAPFPIVIHADDGEVLQISSALTELAGYDHRDVPTTEAWTTLAYGDRALYIQQNFIAKTYALTSRWDEGEFAITTQKGHQRIWHFSSAPLGLLPDGRRAVVSMAADVTERKQAEARVHALLSRTQLLNCISLEIRDSLDLCTIIRSAITVIAAKLPADLCTFAWYQSPTGQMNDGRWIVKREHKADRLSSSLGTYTFDQFPQLLSSIVNNQVYRVNALIDLPNNQLAEHLNHIGVSAFLCIPIHTGGGKIGSLQVGRMTSSQPWQDEEIELLQAIANQVAIAIYQAELYEESQAKTEQLQRSYQDLEAAQRHMVQAEKMSSLGQLVAGVAHEINNPVGFIYGNMAVALEYANSLTALIKLYQEHYPTPPDAIADLAERVDTAYILSDFPKLLASVENGATRIQNIVQSLRTFSRLERADSSEVDIHRHIDNTLVLLQNRLNGRAGNPKIQVVKRYGGLPLIECYSGLLDQVFMNLLVNAVDAIEEYQESAEPEYSGCITIATAIALDSTVTITIQDNGGGMSAETQANIFNPFFTTKPIGAGTGMGLSISYQIITGSHKGELYCRSAIGRGTTFVIELAQRLPPKV